MLSVDSKVSLGKGIDVLTCKAAAGGGCTFEISSEESKPPVSAHFELSFEVGASCSWVRPVDEEFHQLLQLQKVEMVITRCKAPHRRFESQISYLFRDVSSGTLMT